jgi:hypothetical protein
MIERECSAGIFSIVPYVNAEPYWDSRYDEFSRLRLIGGATASWAPRFAVESNITYQYDTNYSSTNLYALNFILHVFFESNRSRK